MKRISSWAALAATAAALGALALYVGLAHDYRGRFEPGALQLGVSAFDGGEAGTVLSVCLRNAGDRKMVVFRSPGLAAPYEVRLVPAAGGAPLALRSLPPGGERFGSAAMLAPGEELSWNVPLRDLLWQPPPPGEYVLTVAYNPADAAFRRDPRARDLTLGRTEAPPLKIRIRAPAPPGRRPPERPAGNSSSPSTRSGV